MPKKFDNCAASGGKIRTKTLLGDKYVRMCVPKGGGPSVAGYVKKKKKK